MAGDSSTLALSLSLSMCVCVCVCACLSARAHCCMWWRVQAASDGRPTARVLRISVDQSRTWLSSCTGTSPTALENPVYYLAAFAQSRSWA